MQLSHLGLIYALLASADAASNICNTGIYALLKPLAEVPEAGSFCSAKFPTVVTVTATAAKTKRSIAASTPSISTTSTVSRSSTALTSVASTSTTLTTSALSLANNNRFTSTKTTTTSTRTNSKQQLLGSLSAVAHNVASTFCSCNFPPKTVQASPTACAIPAPLPTEVQQCDGTTNTCVDARPTCTPAASDADCSQSCSNLYQTGQTCETYTYDADTGSCYIEVRCCPFPYKGSRLLRSRQIAQKRTWLKKGQQV